MFFSNYEKLCAQRGLSATGAALQMGFSRAAVSAWRKGNRIPQGESLSKIAEFFNVSIDFLLAGIEPHPAASAELTFDDFTYALYNETSKLSEENKAKLLEMARFFQQQQDKQAP